MPNTISSKPGKKTANTYIEAYLKRRSTAASANTIVENVAKRVVDVNASTIRRAVYRMAQEGKLYTHNDGGAFKFTIAR